MTNGKCPGVREQRRLAEDRDDDRVGDHAGEDGRDQRVGLEVVAVQHLDRQQRGAERRAEHGRDAGRDARRPSGCAARRRDTRSSQPHIEPSAPPICMVGPSRPPEPPVPSVKIDASALTHATRLRTTPSWRWKASIIASPPPPRVSGASSEMMPLASAPTRGQQGQQPRAEVGEVGRLGEERLAGRAQRTVAAEILEDQALHDLERGEERGAHQPGRDADDRGVEQHPPDDPQVGGGSLLQNRRQEVPADDALHVARGPPLCPRVERKRR